MHLVFSQNRPVEPPGKAWLDQHRDEGSNAHAHDQRCRDREGFSCRHHPHARAAPGARPPGPVRRVRRPVRARDLDGRAQSAGRGVREGQGRSRVSGQAERLLEALRRPALAAVPRRAADRVRRRCRDLPQARGPEPHRRPQDQQRDRPGDAGPADGQDARDRRDRRGPARRGHGDGLRPVRPGVHGLHGRGRHPPPEAQRLQHEDDGRNGRAGDDRLADPPRRDQRGDARLDGLVEGDALHDRQRGRPAPVSDDRPRLPVGDRPRDPRSSAWSGSAACPTRSSPASAAARTRRGSFIRSSRTPRSSWSAPRPAAGG